MSDIPAARRELIAIYNELRAAGLNQYADKMIKPLKRLTRQPAVRRGAKRHPPITATLRDEIKEYAAEHPGAHFTSIARVFGTNPGRVSEILNGKHDHKKA